MDVRHVIQKAPSAASRTDHNRMIFWPVKVENHQGRNTTDYSVRMTAEIQPLAAIGAAILETTSKDAWQRFFKIRIMDQSK